MWCCTRPGQIAFLPHCHSFSPLSMRFRGSRGVAAAALLLLLFLIRPTSCHARGRRPRGLISAVKDVFLGDHNEDRKQQQADNQQNGPIVTKTAQALIHSNNPSGDIPPNATAPPVAVLHFGQNATVALLRPGPHQAVLSFNVTEVPANAEAWAAQTERVPFLEQWVYTSEAPTPLVYLFDELEGPGSNGSLTQAIDNAMGQEKLLYVLCTGEGAGGGLAMLCGPWAALQFPEANVDVITFGAPWAGYNTQYAWSFTRLVQLSYFWNFTSASLRRSNASSSSDNTTGSNSSDNDGGGENSILSTVAAKVAKQINTDAVLAAVTLPSLPDPYPPDYPNDMGDNLWDLSPIEPQFEPAHGPCPTLLCKTRDIVTAACLVFGDHNQSTMLQGMPQSRLHASSGADAVVAWDNSTGTAIIVWEATESKIDWLQDAILYQSDDFRPGQLDKLMPGVKVHKGFLNQFSSFTTEPAHQEDNITAVILNLSGGQAPWRVVVTGHSLGAALSELTGVWVSTVWPAATMFVTNTGAPQVGDGDWVNLFRATVGRAIRYVNHLDQVPLLPPFKSFYQVPEGLWLCNNLVLVQDRPPLPRDATTWNDHHCETLYVPEISNATAVTVPEFVYNATAACHAC